MTRYGFLIDQDTCIGCHACTTACKAEHDVPLGVNRTWVKYIETGSFPDSRRLFSVMRCNHCDNAPCVAICPTGALFTRRDGIVDFDTTRCIGCKACMNACPYDAVYMHPSEHTAQKCNFCAHRVEVGLEPSCVVVCPTQSIVAGDLDDPASRLSVMLARHDTRVRAPEQGTLPKLFYKGAHEASLDPTQTAIAVDGMIWADTTPAHPTLPVELALTAGPVDGRATGNQGIVARTTYTTPHPTPWGRAVSAYLVTKAIAAGSLMAAALLVALGHAARSWVAIGAPGLALVFAALTGILLVADLEQPRRFLYLFTKPNWSSWLTRGALVLGAHAAGATAWLVAGAVEAPDLVRVLAVPGAVVGAAAAGYTALLLGQCEGRDLWQTPLLLPLLIAQAAAAGSAALLVGDLVVEVPGARAIAWAMVASLGVVAGLTALELKLEGTRNRSVALRTLVRGRNARCFWLVGVLLGIAIPIALLVGALLAGDALRALGGSAGVLAIIGLFGYEDAFVQAGQSAPLS